MGPSTEHGDGFRVSRCGRMHHVTFLAQIYSPQEGRGIGLVAKISAYALQAPRRDWYQRPRTPHTRPIGQG